MKKPFLAAIGAAVLAGAFWLGRDLAFAQPKAAEKSYTLTESQLEDFVQKRIAQALAKGDKGVEQKVMAPESWHTAIFNGVEYTIYTGPGQAMATRWAQSGTKPPAAKPGESTPPAKLPEPPAK